MNPMLFAAIGVTLILALGAAAWSWQRRGRVGRIDTPEEAADAADGALAGFATAAAVVGADGAAALAVAQDGRVAVMKRRGTRIAVREVAWRAVRSTAAGIVVETEERAFGRVPLAGVDALDIRRLTPHLRAAARA